MTKKRVSAAAWPAFMAGRPAWMRALGKELMAFGVMILAILALRSTVVSHYNVPTGSMLPTILPGDHFLADQMGYGLRVPFSDWFVTGPRMPQRGDIAVFPSPLEPGVDLVKRVVALGGDHLEVRGGLIKINGQPLETTLIETTPDGYEVMMEDLMGLRHRIQIDTRRPTLRDYGPVESPAGPFFPMGDNRDHSGDGRQFGSVPVENLRARAVKILYSKEGFFSVRWDRLWQEFQ
ncbi:MAG: signal peptidase I [Bdellovibrionales bacterium]|nr:signal peptidase I [Bdellovibrionales bacterium]